MTTEPVTIRSLVGVYNAEGTVRGELTYLLTKLRGGSSCALCEITHHRVRPRREFTRVAARIPVPFDLIHSDECSDQLRAVGAGTLPCVVAHTDSGLLLLLGPDEIHACHGSPGALVDAISAAVDARSLCWPAGPDHPAPS